MAYRDSDALLRQTLEGAVGKNVPVLRLVYRTERPASAYVIYSHASSAPVLYGDDAVMAERHRYNIDIFARDGHVAMVRAIYDALHAAGFDGIQSDGEDYVDSVDMFHADMSCNYTEVMEG